MSKTERGRQSNFISILYATNMREDIKNMLQLQERDQRLGKIAKELDKIPREISQAEDRLQRDQEKVDAVHGEIQANEVAMKNLELDIETRRDTIAKLKVQQFETKKNEEYRALGNEVIRYGEEVVSLEDQELELMEKGEELKAELKKAEAVRDDTKEQVEEEVSGHNNRAEGSKKRAAELQEERKKFVEMLEPDVIALYDRILKSKGDVAVSPLEKGICGGCHMKVTTATLHNVRSGDQLAHCENCGRVLYWVD